MSLDIDWTLLQPLLSPSSTLLETLNTHLQSTARPSFIGPISITALDFGTVSPEVELKDIRDVWRAFDEGDEEGDDDAFRKSHAEELERRKRERERRGLMSGLDDEAYDMVLSPMVGEFGSAPGDYHPSQHSHSRMASRQFQGTTGLTQMEEDEDMDAMENQSVYSGWSPRQSVAAVGIGAGSIALGAALGQPQVPPSPHTPGQHAQYGHRPHPSLHSTHHSTVLGEPSRRPAAGHERHQSYHTAPYPPSHLYDTHSHLHPHAAAAAASQATYNQRFPSPSAATRHRHSPSPTPPITSSTPPPSPPARPGHLPPPSSSGAGHGIPSVQLHLSISHTSDLSITLLTSLQVNYPSPLFMSLPLKLSITGLSLAADMIIAYSGAKHRLHLTIVPPEEPYDHRRAAEEIPIGQRILPHLAIESEIGHADAHVLRNVGKVERFIADAVRKTLVEELVFPNFHTIAL